MLNRKLPFQMILVSSIVVKVSLLFLLLSIVPKQLRLFLILLFGTVVVAQIVIYRKHARK